MVLVWGKPQVSCGRGGGCGRGCGGKFPISEYKNLWVHVFLSHLVETLFVGLLNAKEEAWIERGSSDSDLQMLG